MRNVEQLAEKWAEFLLGRAFYLPVLGPLFTPGQPITDVLSAILLNSQVDEFLPYDKNSRWHKLKHEKIILPAIITNEKFFCLPVLNTFKKNILKLFYYKHGELKRQDIEQATALFQEFQNAEHIDDCFLYYFNETKNLSDAICRYIYLKQITENDFLPAPFNGVFFYEQLPREIQKTFADLGGESDLEGFTFLWKEHLSPQKALSPIICCADEDKIIGAIGPLDIANDAWDIFYLLPPYFGIKEKYRGLGFSSKLWQAAMDFAYREGAKYTLVQNIASSPAARFYEKHGLTIGAKFYSLQLK